MKITLLKEVIRMQKIAGILKENDDFDLTNAPEFAAGFKREVESALRDAGVDLNRPIWVDIIQGQHYTDPMEMSIDTLIGELEREADQFESDDIQFDTEVEDVIDPITIDSEKAPLPARISVIFSDVIEYMVFQEPEEALNENESDLDLSDTPEFTSSPTLDQFLENPTYTVFFDDSPWENSIFGLVDHGKSCFLTYDFPADEEQEENFETVRLKPGLTVEKIIAAGEKQGFFEKTESGVYVNSDREDELYDWLDSLKA